MREMSARSKFKQQYSPGQTAEKNEKNLPYKPEPAKSFFSNLNIPFLGDIGADSDMALILGLVLILSAEKSDKLLLLALLYILM